MTQKKQKNVLVLYSFATHKTGYYDLLFSRLASKAQASGLVLSRGSLKDLIFRYQNGTMTVAETLTGRDIASFDAVYFELWYKAPEQALAAAHYLTTKNIPFLSEEIASFVPATKLGEMARLVENNLPYPQTISSSVHQLSCLIREDKLALTYPFVLKEASAYGGKMNFLVKTPEEALYLLDEHKQCIFLVQEFLSNSHDFRVIVLGGKARLVLKRSRLDTRKHINNTSAGGEGVLIPLEKVPAKLITLAEKAAFALGRSSYAGVDILERNDTGEYVVLEVNQTPQIEIGAEIDAKMSAMLARISEIAGGSDE